MAAEPEGAGRGLVARVERATPAGRGLVARVERATPAGRGLVARVERATPAGRDRGVDALRALAMLGVVLGHWLVTAWQVRPGGEVALAGPLAYMPALAPVSWVLQTLAVFFFVGGFAAARSARAASGAWKWARRRVPRLLVPAWPVVALWAGVAAALPAYGVPYGSVRALALPALAPLWFLAVFAGLALATPALLRVRRPATLACLAAAAVFAVDAARFGLGAPAWIGWVNVAAGWLVPYALGVAWAGGGLRGRGTAAAMLVGGAAATAVLVAGFGYPAAMVGVTGAPVSNLSPPTAAAVCFGVAQIGVALLLHGPLDRLMRRPRAWAAVALANLAAMPVFLWHLTALALAAAACLPLAPVPGLLAPPSGPEWVAARLAWLPVLAAALAVVARPRLTSPTPASAR
ncbi:hypothetical protein HNP84_001699 [Thermocatellispora tengchongensis]|uniref:Acyltransferase 3 domain-containing protein n=1 Tax=Thermocatellispora tengchongensis TaxID=1073253 RepID=A0A840P0J9_9ACTN|nr:acyltransferase [Thermocatellispora tengchongensis]MBB5131986.1 hypothetical protein [Thermocatellispora tengchongensis]